MVTLEQAVWDIQHIKKRLGDESIINIRFLVNLINQYRARFITAWYEKNIAIQPEWLQMFYEEELTAVDTGYLQAIDPSLIPGTVTEYYGKIKLPASLSGMTNFGIFRVSGTTGMLRFYETSRDRLELMIKESNPTLGVFKWFIRDGDSFYFYQYKDLVNVSLILIDPFDGYMWRNESVPTGRILDGEEYRVNYLYPRDYNGSPPNNVSALLYNGTEYQINDLFVGVQDVLDYEVLIPSTVVGYANKKKSLTIKDPYPIDGALMQDIIFKILTQDLLLESQAVRDAINDGADTLNLIKNVRS